MNLPFHFRVAMDIGMHRAASDLRIPFALIRKGKRDNSRERKKGKSGWVPSSSQIYGALSCRERELERFREFVSVSRARSDPAEGTGRFTKLGSVLRV